MSRILEDYKNVSSVLTEVEKTDFKKLLNDSVLSSYSVSEIRNIIRFIDSIKTDSEFMIVLTSLIENNTIGECENLDFILKFFESDLRRIANRHNN